MSIQILPKIFGKFLFHKEQVIKAGAEYFVIPVVRLYWLLTLAVNLILWILAFLIKRGLNQDLAILHYNTTFGIDYLAPRGQIYWLPLIGLLLLFINGALAFVFLKKDKFLGSLLLVSSLAVNFMVGLGLYSIYLVNFVKIF